MSINVSRTIGERELILETGLMAKQADGAVMVRYGGTVVLVTVVMSKEAREGVDFFPLFVEYREKTYAAGKIPGGFFKREGRPSEKEILTSRLVDRPIRPLFPKGMMNEVQIVATALSSDAENDPDVLAMIGASAALSISLIPFAGPVGALRVGRINDQFIINPIIPQLADSAIDLVVAGGQEGIMMIEAGAREVTESTLIEAIDFGAQCIKDIVELQKELVEKAGRPKVEIQLQALDKELVTRVRELALEKINELEQLGQKEAREEALDLICDDLVKKLIPEGEEPPYDKTDIKLALYEVEEEQVRKAVLEKGIRIDGRGFEDVRPISCEVGMLPRTHGSALFTRGQTQSLAVATLGTSSDEQRIDALEGESLKKFMLHYNFPPFSVGEVKPMRGPGRREIGHGALAERALKPIMPDEDDFPYTVRIVSDILESNGSSSMATVCGATLSLMDAGVPIKAPVSGIAMGLIKGGGKVAILTDIAGLEDHFGDMDFKVTGTEKGVTALQMDIKISGVTSEILTRALEQAKKARDFILRKMLDVISQPRESISSYAPRITTINIDPEKIGQVIGPGGKMIRRIIAETGADINVEDDGRVMVASTNEEGASKAIEFIKNLTAEAEVGKIYQGTVKRLMNFGAFVEILPGKDGLVHVSELADNFVKNVEDVVKIGDQFPVKVIEIDAQGRINLSKKKAAERPSTPAKSAE